MSIWEQILLGIGGLLIVLFFGPGAMAMIEKSRQAEHPDWRGIMIPIGVVVAFVCILVMIARS